MKICLLPVGIGLSREVFDLRLEPFAPKVAITVAHHFVTEVVINCLFVKIEHCVNFWIIAVCEHSRNRKECLIMLVDGENSNLARVRW